MGKTNESSSTALATRGEDTDLIMGAVLPEIEDSEEAQRSIVASILQAEDVAALFTDRSTTATKDVVGIPIRVFDVSLRVGEIDGKDGTYMLINAADLENGEAIVLNTGAPNIMATLWRAKQLGALPMEVSVQEVGRARAGRNAPLGLKPEGETAKLVKAAS